MHLTQLSLALAGLAALSDAAVLENYRRDAPGLSVTLAPAKNAAVVATVTNVGTEDLKLLTLGTFLDSAPVEKLAVKNANATPLEFTGVLRRIDTSALEDDSFITIAAGSSITTTINAAAVHEFESGTYSFLAEGSLPVATANSTTLSGAAVSFKSNVLTMSVDGEVAASVAKAIPVLSLAERTTLQSGCTSSNQAATVAALSSCASLARAAATAATSGSATKFNEYFKSTAASVRATVAARLTAVANQCASTTSGVTKYYCSDVYGYCASNVLAYTIPSLNVIVNCPIYYTVIPALSSTCHAQDRATTTLHEMTHAPGVYSPGTVDNGYGYALATALTSARAVLNADSYALYANAIRVGC